MSRPPAVTLRPLALPYPTLPAPAAEAGALASPEPTRRVRRRRLVTVRLVCEGPFPAPDGYPAEGVPIRSPQDVFAHMQPYAARECAESFWMLPLEASTGSPSAAPSWSRAAS